MLRKFKSPADLHAVLLGLIFFALALLRFQAALNMDQGLWQAWSLRIYLGWLSDAVVVFLIFGIALVLRALIRLPVALSLAGLGLWVWLANLTNVLYAKFFGGMVHWWVLRLHAADLIQVRGSAQSLAVSWGVLISLVLILLVFLLAVFCRREKAWSRGSAVKNLCFGLAVFVFALLLRQSPVWFRAVHKAQNRGTILTEQVLKIWWDEAIAHPERYTWQSKTFGRKSTREEMLKPILRYSNRSSVPYVFEASTESRSKLLKALGLNPTKPIHLVILFLESLRAYEFDHPQMGPQIFPNLRKWFQENAFSYQQAYSSSINAGQTVRGQFSTLCSMLPNLLGPATYIAHYTLRVDCLPEVLKNAGYSTVWINSHDKHFHNKELFERLHGMQYFYDKAYFQKQGITRVIGDWGLADEPVLVEGVKILNKHAEKGPVFAHLLTVGTHHPFSEVPETPVPQALVQSILQKNPKAQAYLGYLSRQKYADQAASRFLQNLFESPMGDSTLVVVLGDHGNKVEVPEELKMYQKWELPFRIPLAFISKHPKTNRRYSKPVHQIDVAPTLAALAGIKALVTWQGRPIGQGELGSAWVYQEEKRIYYRQGDLACYSPYGKEAMQCWKVPQGKDALFDSDLVSAKEDLSLTQFYRQTVEANSGLILKDQVKELVFRR